MFHHDKTTSISLSPTSFCFGKTNFLKPSLVSCSSNELLCLEGFVVGDRSSVDLLSKFATLSYLESGMFCLSFINLPAEYPEFNTRYFESARVLDVSMIDATIDITQNVTINCMIL